MNEEPIEQLSYILAHTKWEIEDAGCYSEWSDRQHWKVPRMVYDAMAKEAIEFIRAYDATSKD